MGKDRDFKFGVQLAVRSTNQKMQKYGRSKVAWSTSRDLLL